jgi:hypothetical protein
VSDTETETEYKRYYGIMDYFATGEGFQQIYYVSWAKDADAFKAEMIQDCQIYEYYHIAIEISDTITENTPPMIVEHFRRLKNGVGFMKFHSYVNYS